jgi:hydroxyacylglutathione hydrolase
MKNSLVHTISLKFVNAFLIKGDRSILVDTGWPGDAERILKVLSSQNVDPTEISLILLTHGHSDHYGSVAPLQKATDAPVAIHRADAQALRCGTRAVYPCGRPIGMLGSLVDLYCKRERALSPIVEAVMREQSRAGIHPDILIEHEMSLEHFGVSGTIISTPGHTPGSISVLLESREAVVGDLICGGVIRHNVPYLFYGDTAQMKKSLRVVMGYTPRTLFAGHFGPFDSDAVVKRYICGALRSL